MRASSEDESENRKRTQDPHQPVRGAKSWQKAIDALYAALTYFPDDVTYWFVLSDIYDGMGRSDSTEVALRSVLKIDPENTRAKQFLEKLGTKEAL